VLSAESTRVAEVDRSGHRARKYRAIWAIQPFDQHSLRHLASRSASRHRRLVVRGQQVGKAIGHRACPIRLVWLRRGDRGDTSRRRTRFPRWPHDGARSCGQGWLVVGGPERPPHSFARVRASAVRAPRVRRSQGTLKYPLPTTPSVRKDAGTAGSFAGGKAARHLLVTSERCSVGGRAQWGCRRSKAAWWAQRHRRARAPGGHAQRSSRSATRN